MIRCYLLDGKFEEREFDNFYDIAAVVDRNRARLYDLKLGLIVDILNQLGKKIIQDKNINTEPGITYISMWLRRENLERICRINYTHTDYLENFRTFEDYFDLNAQPRGIVCHWIAGNIPTIAFFSLAQSILSKNGSILKVPEENCPLILSILKNLGELEIERDGARYSGKDVLGSIAIVSFSSREQEISQQFSMIADVKIAWGGTEAVNAIRALPQKEHCECIVFGPKYSFGVFDRAFIESESFDWAIDYAVRDVAVFNQMACSSPHVFFFEKSRYSLEEISHKMRASFEKTPAKLLNQPTPAGVAAKIINARAMYLLSSDKNAFISDDISWTILTNGDITLEDPIQGKCIFIKEVDSIDEVLGLITRKIQAMSVGIADPARKRAFAKRAAYQGVDRLVPPGKMHDYDLPWDGIMSLNRLVRWIILKD